jgi:hypothetical protein
MSDLQIYGASTKDLICAVVEFQRKFISLRQYENLTLVVSALLGGGERLFDGVGDDFHGLEPCARSPRR